jgi:predicted aldo/keto reductase-like oxidoreductase
LEHTTLGRTGLEVSRIGIGTEHLLGQSRETVVGVIREAAERGVNYFDLIFAHADYVENMRAAFEGLREQVLLTAHLGSTEKEGQYFKSRSPNKCETSFLNFLSRLGTDHVDVLFLHNFNSVNDWQRVVKPGGVAELAQRLREEGRARAIGISAHYAGVVKLAIESGVVDIVMFPVNLFGHAMPGRQEVLEGCAREGMGLVAMKPFGGGKLLNKRGTLRVAKYQTGGETFRARIDTEITPVQCLAYTLKQAGVSMALAGVKNRGELASALEVVEAAEEERDFSGLLTHFGRYVEGECVYCNHCLPCPAVIDIGQVMRLMDLAQWGVSPEVRRAYGELAANASDCTECGACEKRCPFGVEVVVKMRQTVAAFG